MILRSKRALALFAVASMAAVPIARADPPVPVPSTGQEAQPGRAERRPIVQPPSDVDPRMPVVKPAVPTRSRVIRPDARSGSSGTVVVPK